MSLIFKDKIREHRFLQYIVYYLIPYTVAFLLLQFIVFYAFKSSGKSFIWEIDGINQHYPALQYYSQFLKNLLQGKGLPMVDFNVGMGFDVLTTLNYYAIGDPITLLTIFGNPENMEGLYRFLILLRFYLVGLSFTLYCLYMKKKGFPSVLGGLIYVFCGYLFYAGTRHPYFTNPMIYLPLLFLGLEHVLEKKKPYVFIIMVFISALSNFYFFYMLTILIFVYAVVRFFITYKKVVDKSIGLEFIKTAVRTGLFYVLGVIMAAILLMPVIGAFFNNGRFASGYDVNLLHYTKGHYVLMVNSFLAPNINSGYWTQLTYAAIVAVGIMIIFRNKRHRELMIGFIVATIFLMIPAIGYLMNGFAYVSNRWEFGYSFLIAFIFVATYEEMFQLKGLDKLLLLIGTGVYFALGLIRPNKYIWISLIFLCLTIIVIFIFNHYRKSLYLQKLCIFLLVFCNLGVNGFLTYDSKYGNYVSEYIDAGKVQETIQKSAVSLISQIEDDSFYRIETFGDRYHNEALTLDYNDVASYFSIMDKNVTEYMKDLELLNLRTAYRFDDLDYRTILGSLASVKYLVTRDKYVAPYGYKLISEQEQDGGTYYLLENQYVLPLGYTYKQYITKENYQKLQALEKQEVMLQAVVVDQPIEGITAVVLEDNEVSDKDSVELLTQEIPYSLEIGDGISMDGNNVKVTKKGARLRIYFDGIKEAETYVRLMDFNINDTKYFNIDLKIKGEAEVTKTINVRAKKNNSYFGKDDYIINLGYKSDVMNYCDITFNDKGKFYLGGLQVYVLPKSDYIDKVNALKEFSMDNIVMENNHITGTINLLENRLLNLSIPYSKGWTAYVNGKKTEILKANIMYMALPLQAGNNKIELRYTTPLLKEGILLSVVGWFIFACIIVFDRMIKSRAKKLINNSKVQL